MSEENIGTPPEQTDRELLAALAMCERLPALPTGVEGRPYYDIYDAQGRPIGRSWFVAHAEFVRAALAGWPDAVRRLRAAEASVAAAEMRGVTRGLRMAMVRAAEAGLYTPKLDAAVGAPAECLLSAESAEVHCGLLEVKTSKRGGLEVSVNGERIAALSVELAVKSGCFPVAKLEFDPEQ